MKSRRGLLARASAVAGATLLFLVPLVNDAGAQTTPLPLYETSGVGRGITATFAVEPSIFNPLLDAGLLYAQASTTSQGEGQSYALGAQMFPGTFAVGAATGEVGCDGIPIAPWAQALYPPTDSCDSDQDVTIAEPGRPPFGIADMDPLFDPFQPVFDPIRERLTIKGGELSAHNGRGHSAALVKTSRVALHPDASLPAIVSIDALTVESTGDALDAAVTHVVTVRATGVELLGGVVKVDSVVTRAMTSSDASSAVADARVTFGEASVIVDGTERRATIDNRGIRINDPALSRDQNLSLQESFEEGLVAAGVSIEVSSPAEVTEDDRAEASIGGLVLGFRGTLPTVPIPAELAPAIGSILSSVPTHCLYEFTPPSAPALPLCFGAGVLPGAGSAFPLMINIASATSFAYGATGMTGLPPLDPPELCPGLPACDLTGVPAPPPTVFQPGPVQLPPITDGITSPIAPGTTPAGISSGLPAAGMLAGGIALVILALGMALGPSLVHGAR